MSKSVSEELAIVKDLINEVKYEEALQYLGEIEQKEKVTPEETLRTQKLKGRIYYFLGKYEISLKIAEELFQKSHEMNMPLFTLDALFQKERTFYTQQRFEEFFKTLEEHEELFKSIPREDSKEFQEREAGLLMWKSGR